MEFVKELKKQWKKCKLVNFENCKRKKCCNGTICKWSGKKEECRELKKCSTVYLKVKDELLCHRRRCCIGKKCEWKGAKKCKKIVKPFCTITTRKTGRCKQEFCCEKKN